MADRLTGKASYIVYNSNVLSITSYTPTTDRALADTTDNGDYNATADMIFPTQLPVSAKTTIEVEGRFRKSQTPAVLLANLYTGVSAVPVVLGLDAGTLYGHGNFDISNFKTSVPVEDTVTFTCTLQSNGQFTPNA